MKLSLSKSNLFSDKTQFLGFDMEKGTVRPLKKHVEKIRNMTIPTSKQELRRLAVRVSAMG